MKKKMKKTPSESVMESVSTGETMSKEHLAVCKSFLWPESSAVMTAGIHLLILTLLCTDLVSTVDPGKNLQCCYPHKNLLSSKNIVISTLSEDLEVR